MSNLYNFPSHFVYWEKIKNHKEIKENILPLILEHSDRLSYTSDESTINYFKKYKCRTDFFSKDNFLNNLFQEYGYEDIIIWNTIDNLLSHKDLKISHSPKESNIIKIWYNVYSPGGYHNVHTHGYSHGFSGIYILDLKEKNPTTFFNGGEAFLEETFELSDVEEGTVVIFLNSLKHFVQPCLKNRVTLSFNINSPKIIKN